MSASLFTVRRFLVIFSIAWVILMSDHAILLWSLDWPVELAIIDSVISNILLSLVCLLVMNTVRYYKPGFNQYMNVLCMCIVLTVLWLVLSKWLLNVALDSYEGYTVFLRRSLMVRFSTSFLIVGIVTTIGINWYNWQDQKRSEERKSDAEKLARDAELFKLRQQLQPHFLFNSLNSINALIGSRPEEARRMVQQLSDFLRGTIKKEETQWVSLQEEMQYLELYLEIEKVRFGNRLTPIVTIDPLSVSQKLPALLLQPLVENAIKFGLYDTIGETVIRINTVAKENELEVIVSNPFDPETSSPRQGTGFGLKSVQRRLYLLFDRSDLVVTEAKDHIFTTRVTIPQLPEA